MPRTRPWQHPWLRISLLLRPVLGTQWDAATWQQIQRELPKALVMKAAIQRAGRRGSEPAAP